MIAFNQPTLLPNSLNFADSLGMTKKFSGDGSFSKKCHLWFEEKLGSKVLLTTSCTHALEMMAILLKIGPGDEVIVPSYTFVSTANAFALRGAKIVFVDIRADTMNIDETLLEAAITSKTKAIVVVHYAGVSCEMDQILKIGQKHNIFILEDAAQGMMGLYKNKWLGTLGALGTYSFHETKNYHCGEGGLLIINDPDMIKTAEIIREKGTDRSSFLRGEIDKYTWQMIGSSYLPSEINAAFLWPQLHDAHHINHARLANWQQYFTLLSPLANKGFLELPVVPEGCTHNAHMFYLKTLTLEKRTALIEYLKQKGVMAVFHYVPLHSAKAGQCFARLHGTDKYTTQESERLVRLPIWYGISENEIQYIINTIIEFYQL